MIDTTQHEIDLLKLSQVQDKNQIISRLMMAYNDISNCNILQQQIESNIEPEESIRGKRGHLLNIQCGHLCEAMDIIRDIHANPENKKFIDRFTNMAQEAYSNLVSCLPEGSERQKYINLVVNIRDELAFHYGDKSKSQKKYQNALNNRVKRSEIGQKSKITCGDFKVMRFNAADDIVDSIVCREIWRIPESEKDIRKAADDNIIWISDLAQRFCGFAWEFVCSYLFENGRIGTGELIELKKEKPKYDISKRQAAAFQASSENAKHANDAIKISQNWLLVLGLAEMSFLGSLILKNNESVGRIYLIKLLLIILLISFMLFISGSVKQYKHVLMLARKYENISNIALNYLKQGFEVMDKMPNELEFPNNQIISDKWANILLFGSYLTILVVTSAIAFLIFIL